MPQCYLVRTETIEGKRPRYSINGKRVSEETYWETYDRLTRFADFSVLCLPSGRVKRSLSGVYSMYERTDLTY